MINTWSKSYQTLPVTDQMLSMTDQTLSVTDQTLPMTDQTLPVTDHIFTNGDILQSITSKLPILDICCLYISNKQLLSIFLRVKEKKKFIIKCFNKYGYFCSSIYLREGTSTGITIRFNLAYSVLMNNKIIKFLNLHPMLPIPCDKFSIDLYLDCLINNNKKTSIFLSRRIVNTSMSLQDFNDICQKKNINLIQIINNIYHKKFGQLQDITNLAVNFRVKNPVLLAVVLTSINNNNNTYKSFYTKIFNAIYLSNKYFKDYHDNFNEDISIYQNILFHVCWPLYLSTNNSNFVSIAIEDFFMLDKRRSIHKLFRDNIIRLYSEKISVPTTFFTKCQIRLVDKKIISQNPYIFLYPVLIHIYRFHIGTYMSDCDVERWLKCGFFD